MAVDVLPLACRAVTRTARERTILDAVSLEARAGEIVGLIGANGSGKTSLMRAALGLVRIQSGTVKVFGMPAGSRLVAPRVGAAVGPPAVYSWMTGRSMLRALADLGGVPYERADEALARFGLADAARRLTGRYSEGMKRRLALAAVDMRDADLVVLDEPTSGLDGDGVELVHDWMAATRARGAAVVLASHHLREVERLCDEVVYLESGRVRASGSVADVREHLDPRLVI